MRPTRPDKSDRISKLEFWAAIDFTSAMEFHWGYVLSAFALYVGSFFASLFAVTFVLVKLPRTYFLERSARGLWIDQHAVVRYSLIGLKNLLGLSLIALGVLLSVPGIPGQGVLTIIIGLLFIDFPGKRRWERRLVSRPRVLRAINRIRARFGKEPLLVSEQP